MILISENSLVQVVYNVNPKHQVNYVIIKTRENPKLTRIIHVISLVYM